MSKTFTRELYISADPIADLMTVGSQGLLINNIIEYHDVRESIKCLNAIAMDHEMFPCLSFSALSYTDLSFVKCVIIGGMPNSDRLETWTGSAYSYDDSTIPTILHKKIVDDMWGGTAYTKALSSDFAALQCDGFLMMHEALSVTKEEAITCRELWAPIVFRILNEISKSDNDVPIIFTTVAARNSFYNAVLNSNNVFCLAFSGENVAADSPNTFEYVEAIINHGVTAASKTDILKLITKCDKK
jgi:uracil DNA glycosylase